MMQAPSSGARLGATATLQGLADKLVHPLLEVRRRALQSLEFKVKHGLLVQDDFVQERTLLRNLLGLLKQPDNGEQLDASSLLLLQRIAITFPLAARQLLQMGCEDTLRAARPSKGQELQQLLDATLATLASAPLAPAPAAGGQLTDTPARAVNILQHSVSVGAASRREGAGATGAVGGYGPAGVGPGGAGPGGAGAGGAWPMHPPVARPLELEFAGAAQQQQTPALMPAALQAAALQQQPWSTPAASAYSGVMDSVVGLPTALRGSRPGTASASVQRPELGSSSRAAAARHEQLGPSFTGRQQGQPPSGASRSQRDGAAVVPACGTDWLLPPVALAPSDEQYLFELGVRLQHVQDPVHIALPALQELLFGAAADMPAEVLVAQPGLTDHLLAMVGISTDGIAPLQAPAAALLGRLFQGLKQSLAAATHPLHAAPPAGAQTPAQPATTGPGGPQGAAVAVLRVGSKYSPNRWKPGGIDAAAVALQASGQGGGGGGGGAGGGAAGEAAGGGPPAYPQPVPQLPPHLQQGPHLQRHIEQHGLLNVSALACGAAVRLLPLLASPALHPLVLPLLQELLPLLLVNSQGSTPGPGDEVAKLKLSLMLQPLAQALVSCLAIARSESAAIVQAYQDDSADVQPPVLSVPAANIIILATKLLASSSPDAWVPDVVPPALTDTLATVITDAVCVTALPPGWAEAVGPVLDRLRPDVRQVLGVAGEGEAAVVAAVQLEQQLPHLLAGTVAPRDWLATLTSALLVLDLAPNDTSLLQTMLQGLAFVCSSASMEGEGVQSQAEGVVLTLLAHPLPAVQLSTHSLLEDLLGKVRSEPDPALVSLLVRRHVCQHLVVAGLSDPRLRPHAAALLLQLMHRAQHHVNAELLHWSGWIAAYHSDPHVSALACGVDLLQQAVTRQEAKIGAMGWQQLEVVLVQLLSSKVDVRRAASVALRDLLHATQGVHIPANEPQSIDPLKAVLDGGLRDPLVLPGAASSGPASGPASAAARLARSFRAQDADNLLSILGNNALATELRKSAAAQLLSLVLEPALRDHMSQPPALAVMMDALCSTLRPSSPTSPAPTTSEALTHLDMALPVSAANLLYALTSLSPQARAWVCSSAGGATALQQALPLLFHALLTVRHALGRLVAALALGREADKWGGWGALAGASHGASSQQAQEAMAQGALLRLPRPFTSGYLLPCKVVWLEIPAEGDVWTAGSNQPAQAALLKGRPKLQELVASQRARVALLVEQRRLLSAAQGQLAGCVAQLQARPGAWRMSGAAAQCCCHNVNALSLQLQVEVALSAVGSAGSHEEGHRALRSLAQLAASDQGLAALAGAGWQVALDPLLVNSPLSLEDRQLWLELLPLVQRLLGSGHLSGVQLLHLALCLHQSCLPLLSEPRAAQDPPLVPVALAGSMTLEDNTGAPSSHLVQLVVLQTSQQALLALLLLVRQAGRRLPIHEALRVVQALRPVELCRLAVRGYVAAAAAGPEGGASYGCRVLAVALVAEVLAVLRSAALAPSPQDAPHEHGLEEALVECLVSLLSHICSPTASSSSSSSSSSQRITGGGGADQTDGSGGGNNAAQPATTPAAGGMADERHGGGLQRGGGGGAQGGVQGGNGGVQGGVGAVQGGVQGGGGGGSEGVFQGKALVRQALACVAHLMHLLPTQLWSTAWQQESSVYWLTRLSRDRDTRLRSSALALLASLMRPGAGPTQRALAVGWPDAAPRLMRLVTTPGEPYGVRAGALRFLCVALALPAPLPQDTPASASITASIPRHLVPLSPESLLKQSHFWDQLPALLLDRAAPPAFVHACVALLLQGLVVDVEAFATHLRYPSLFSHLLGILAAPGQHLLATSGHVASPAVTRLMEAGSPCTDDGGAAAGLQLGLWDDGACVDLEHRAVGLVVGPPYSLGLQAAQQQQQPGGGGGATQQKAGGGGGGGGGGRVWKGWEGESEEGCQGLMVRWQGGEEQPAVLQRAGDTVAAPLSQALQSDILICVTAVSHVVALAVMESDLVDVVTLGHTHVRLLAASLGALIRVAHQAALLDRMHVEGLSRASARTVGLVFDSAHELSVLAGNLAHLLTPQQLIAAQLQAQAQLAPGEQTPLLVVLADLLTARTASAAMRLATASLAATVLADSSVADSLLQVQPQGAGHAVGGRSSGEHVSSSTGEPVGAALCLALISTCPQDLLSPAPRAEAATALATQHQDLEAESLVFVVALRNVLAHSASAKVAALRVGLHTALQGACVGACQALEAAARRPSGAGSTSSSRRPTSSHVSLRAGCKPPAPANAGTPAMQSSLQAAAGDGDGADEGWSSPLTSPTRRPPASPALPASPITHLASLAPSLRGAATRRGTASGPAAAASRPAGITVAASVAGTAGGGAGERPASGCALAAHPQLEVRVTVALSLLKHLAYRSPPSRQLLLRGGLLEAVRLLWRQGLVPLPPAGRGGPPPGLRAGTDGGGRAQAAGAETGAGLWADGGTAAGGRMGGGRQGGGGSYFVASPALHEALGLLTNMLPECGDARAALARDGTPTLLQCVLALMFECKLESSTWSLAASLVSHLAATPDGCTALLRGGATGAPGGGAGEGFLGAAQRVVVDVMEEGPPGRGREVARAVSLMQVLGNLAAHAEGQRTILKSGGFARLTELMLAGPLGTEGQDQPTSKQWPQALVLSGLLLVRNLCFSPESKAHLLVHPRALPCLVAHVERVGDSPQAAATAASAIWALIYQGEKVKSALRRVPSAVSRLTAALATAEFRASRLSKVAQPLPTLDSTTTAAAGAAAAAASDGSGGGMSSKAAAAAVELLRWVQTAADSIRNVLQLMEGTAAASAGAVGAAGGKLGDLVAGGGGLRLGRDVMQQGEGRDAGPGMPGRDQGA